MVASLAIVPFKRGALLWVLSVFVTIGVVGQMVASRRHSVPAKKWRLTHLDSKVSADASRIGRAIESVLSRHPESYPLQRMPNSLPYALLEGDGRKLEVHHGALIENNWKLKRGALWFSDESERMCNVLSDTDPMTNQVMERAIDAFHQ